MLYLDIIKRYNRKKHLLFVDPPYPKSGHGLYYHDYLFNKGGVAIERVITNFPFTGCYHYDTEEPWQGE